MEEGMENLAVKFAILTQKYHHFHCLMAKFRVVVTTFSTEKKVVVARITTVSMKKM